MEQLTVLNKRFGWRVNGSYTVLDLGTMPNAVIIKQEEEGRHFCISLRGYFSFPDNYYKMRFENEKEAIEFACKYLLQWIEEMNNHLLYNLK